MSLNRKYHICGEWRHKYSAQDLARTLSNLNAILHAYQQNLEIALILEDVVGWAELLLSCLHNLASGIPSPHIKQSGFSASISWKYKILAFAWSAVTLILSWYGTPFTAPNQSSLEPLNFILDTTMNEECSEPIAIVMYHQQLRLDTIPVLPVLLILLLQQLLYQSKSKK